MRQCTHARACARRRAPPGNGFQAAERLRCATLRSPRREVLLTEAPARLRSSWTRAFLFSLFIELVWAGGAGG